MGFFFLSMLQYIGKQMSVSQNIQSLIPKDDVVTRVLSYIPRVSLACRDGLVLCKYHTVLNTEWISM